jgi:hypothetical protein
MKQPAITVWSVALALFLLATVVSMTAFAGGENRVGTNAAPELLIPVGARDIALGGSSIATTSGIEAIYWNPAGLARSTHNANAMFSHMNYIADIGVEYVAVSAGFEGFGTIGLSLKSISIGDIAVTTEDQPDGTGGTFTPTIVNFGFTYSRSLTDRVSVGATVNLISERFDKVSATGFGFNAGVQYNGLGGVNGLSVGVAVKNIGPQMQFSGDGLLRQGQVNDVLRPGSFYRVTAASFELPSTIEIGLAYAVDIGEQNGLNLTGMFQNNNFSVDEYKLGAEYSYDNTFFLRGGYNLSESKKNNALTVSDKTSFIYGFTAGAGIHYPVGNLDIGFDYAFRAVSFFQNNHIFAITLGF